MEYTLTINGEPVKADVEPGTPLLWVLRDHLKLTGTKFGCGAAQCGACSVLLDGKRAFSCVTPIDSIEGRKITTIEGLSDKADHPVQKAWIKHRVPQCGYCQSGMIINAVSLLNDNPTPNRDEITQHMDNICRCGTYTRILAAIEDAALEMSQSGESPADGQVDG